MCLFDMLFPPQVVSNGHYTDPVTVCARVLTRGSGEVGVVRPGRGSSGCVPDHRPARAD